MHDSVEKRVLEVSVSSHYSFDYLPSHLKPSEAIGAGLILMLSVLDSFTSVKNIDQKP